MAIRRTTRIYADDDTVHGIIRMLCDRGADYYIGRNEDPNVSEEDRDYFIDYGASLVFEILAEVDFIDYPERFIKLFDQRKKGTTYGLQE